MKNRQKREKIGRFVTIYKRGRKYYADIVFGGTRERQALGTSNIKAARLKALDLDAELRRGETPQKMERLTIADAAEGYVAYAESEGRRPKTLEKYRALTNGLCEYIAGTRAVYLDQVNLLFVEKYRAHLRKVGYADKTIADKTVFLKMLTKWAIQRDLLQKDPLAGLKGIKQKPKTQPCFTLEQVELIVSTAQGQLRDICEVLAFSGMRIGELQWLSWDDVDFEKNIIRIRPKDDWIPKHGRSRVIPMHDRVRDVLQRQPRKHRWIFTTRKSPQFPRGGNRINESHILYRLKRLLKKLGIEGHLHTFRHFFASHCANSGVPAFQLIKWLGHADVSIVMHYYALHDEQSQWTMQKLSLTDSKRKEKTGAEGEIQLEAEAV